MNGDIFLSDTTKRRYFALVDGVYSVGKKTGAEDA